MPPSAAPSQPRSRGRSLNDVRAIIPAECYEPSRLKAVVALAQGAVLFLAPMAALAVTNRWWAVPILWLLAGLGIAGLFVLGHDASHMALFRSRKVNRAVAWACFVPSAHIEAAWNLGHNRVHHGYTARKGFDFVWHPTTVDEFQEMSGSEKLRHRVEWSFLGSGAYYVRVVWWEKMWRFAGGGKHGPAIQRGKTRLGSLLGSLIVATAVAGAFQGGIVGAIWVPIKLLVVPFLIFIQVIGWTVYVHHVAPDIRWWTRRDWSQFKGQMESTTILRFPRLINRLWFHNIFVHVPHHVDARLPFHQLPAAAAAIRQAFPDTVKEDRFRPTDYLHAARACKLYDFDEGRWLPYSAAS